MAWIDRFGDRDGDGFQEYATRSSHGYYNQGWKDAGDAIPDEDGTLAPLPIAPCELQGYVYDAKLRLARDLRASWAGRGRATPRRARPARCTSGSTRRSGGRREGTYYLGLDGAKRPIRSVASNAGPPALQSGIVPPERAGRVVRRLLADDMWSGWGIRTLSSDHPPTTRSPTTPASVWPHDNAIIAGGFRRYGYAAEAAQVAKGMFDAAERLRRDTACRSCSPGCRAVEAASPCQYLGANVPQAWAAGSVFRLVAVLSGIHATADADGSTALRRPGAARLDAGADDPQPAGRPWLDVDPDGRRLGRGAREHDGLRGRPWPGTGSVGEPGGRSHRRCRRRRQGSRGPAADRLATDREAPGHPEGPMLVDRLRFGISITPMADAYPDLVRQVLVAEHGGLDLVGIQDHPYQRRFLDTFALIADLLARTSRAVVLPGRRQPAPPWTDA